MVPVGWTKMECPKTKELVTRKVAKIVQDKNVQYWHQRNVKPEAGINTTVKKVAP